MRDCTNCSHYKTEYTPYLHEYIKSCEVWQCKFEQIREDICTTTESIIKPTIKPIESR